MTQAPATDGGYVNHTDVAGHFDDVIPPHKSRRQKNIERVAQEAERKQRFAKGGSWK